MSQNVCYFGASRPPTSGSLALHLSAVGCTFQVFNGTEWVPVAFGPLHPGDWVRVRWTEETGEVLGARGGMWEVRLLDGRVKTYAMMELDEVSPLEVLGASL